MKVFSKRPDSDDVIEDEVTDVFWGKADSLLEIEFDDGSTVMVTNEHPFHLDGHGWRQAQTLDAGDKLSTKGGMPTTVVSVRRLAFDIPVPVITLRVKINSTYFVSEHEVLVHNK